MISPSRPHLDGPQADRGRRQPRSPVPETEGTGFAELIEAMARVQSLAEALPLAESGAAGIPEAPGRRPLAERFDERGVLTDRGLQIGANHEAGLPFPPLPRTGEGRAGKTSPLAASAARDALPGGTWSGRPASLPAGDDAAMAWVHGVADAALAASPMPMPAKAPPVRTLSATRPLPEPTAALRARPAPRGGEAAVSLALSQGAQGLIVAARAPALGETARAALRDTILAELFRNGLSIREVRVSSARAGPRETGAREE